MRKILALILCTALLTGVVCIPANAAAPIVFDKNQTVHFDQSFAGGTDASSFGDFDIKKGSGQWMYAPDYIMETSGSGSVFTKNTYNMSGADSFEFKIQTITTNNGYKAYIGWDDATKTGYTLSVNRNLTVLFKGPIEYTTSWGIDYDHENCLAYTNSDNGNTPLTGTSYGGVVNATIRVEGNKMSISTDVGDRNGTLVYEAPEKIAVNGKFGIEGGTNTCFTLFSMSLTSGDSTATVNNWKFEHNFNTADTIESLAKQDLIFDNNAVEEFGDGYVTMKTGGSLTCEYKPNDGSISGDYTIEAKMKKEWGEHKIKFNCIDDANYYQLISAAYNKGSNMKVEKIVNGLTTSYYDVVNEDETSESYIPGTYTTYAYKIDVRETDAGIEIDVSITGDNGKTWTIPTCTDASPFSKRGTVKLCWSNSGTSPDCKRAYYFKAYSTPSGEDTVSDVTLIDKTITEIDTVTSLANEYGIICDSEPTAITNNGIVWDQSGWFYGNCNVKLAGDYTLTAIAQTPVNQYTYYINYNDEQNYYRLDINNDGSISATKRKNNTDTTLNVTTGTVNGYTNHSCKDETAELDVKHNDGEMTIDVKLSTYVGTKELSIVDPSDTIESGIFRWAFYYNTYDGCWFKKIKVVSHSRPSGIVEGIFKVNGTATYGYAKGDIKFSMPTAVLGSYKVIAALYEDNLMTDIKVFDEVDLFGSELNLFNTSGSTAQKGSVKVYLVDTTDTLNKITDTWELK